MPVPEQVTVNSSTANGLTTVFPYSFKIIEEGDLAVELDGVVQTTGFTISGAGEDTGGDVTFAVPPASGVVVNRYLDPPLRRITDYQQHGDYNSETLDADFDRGWTAMQSLSERISRCLQVSIGTTPTPEALLTLLNDAVYSVTSGLSSKVTVVANITALRALPKTGAPSAFVYGSGGLYYYDSTDTTSADNGVTIIVATDGARWKLLHNGTISAEQAGAVGDGVTDDTAAITRFFNSAISNPGVEHRLSSKTYIVSSTLPTINVSNVQIIGAGARMRDLGVIDGTRIKWNGAANGTMLTISAVSGAGNYCVSNVKILGVGFDGNSGLAGTGVVIKSVKESDFNIVCTNFNTNNLVIDVVPTLAEGRDTQKNRITYWGRNVEGTGKNGVSLRLKGDTGANTSFNNLWVDIQHGDYPAIVIENADNNDWWMCRTYHGAGAATESISFLGGASAFECARSERFHSLSTSLPVRAYGTGTYASAAANISLLWNDQENATPEPIVDTGATIYWNKSNTPFGSYPWQSYTPVITAGSGTFTTVSAQGYFRVRGKMCDYKIYITVTTNGTASLYVIATLPVQAYGTVPNIGVGKEIAVTYKTLSSYVGPLATTAQISNYDGSYCAGNGYVLVVQGSYEIAQ